MLLYVLLLSHMTDNRTRCLWYENKSRIQKKQFGLMHKNDSQRGLSRRSGKRKENENIKMLQIFFFLSPSNVRGHSTDRQPL